MTTQKLETFILKIVSASKFAFAGGGGGGKYYFFFFIFGLGYIGPQKQKKTKINI